MGIAETLLSKTFGNNSDLWAFPEYPKIILLAPKSPLAQKLRELQPPDSPPPPNPMPMLIFKKKKALVYRGVGRCGGDVRIMVRITKKNWAN